MHIVDIFSEEAQSHYTNKAAFEEAMTALAPETDKGGARCQLHARDWGEFGEEWDKSVPIDFLWLDGFNRETFYQYWPYVSENGGAFPRTSFGMRSNGHL